MKRLITLANAAYRHKKNRRLVRNGVPLGTVQKIKILARRVDFVYSTGRKKYIC